MYRHCTFKTLRKSARVGCQFYSTASTKPTVWVVTDGGIESTLHAMTLGKQLSGSNRLSTQLKLKTFHSSKTLQLFPAIVQKYLVNWGTSKGSSQKLPWYLTSQEQTTDEESKPDYIIASGQDAIPACLHYSKLNEKSFSVYVGYPSIPFINFDKVILPKYEANAKMAALGPLARQKNGIITPAPLLDTPSFDNTPLHSLIPFKNGFSSVVVGGHSSVCRWYSEDAITLADNVKRIVNQLDDKVVVVYTDRTPQLVKDKMTKRLAETIKDHEKSVFIWDSTTLNENTAEKINIYESIIQYSQRVILTADLDYACSHALSKSKPVYVTFGGRCRSYLLQFHRWVLDGHLTRKLRLDKSKHSKAEDPYSYLGRHAPWNNVSKVFQIKQTMSFVKNEIQVSREEKVTGKRRKN